MKYLIIKLQPKINTSEIAWMSMETMSKIMVKPRNLTLTQIWLEHIEFACVTEDC